MRTVFCVKYQASLEGLEAPPYPGELGEKIYASVSKKAWNDWMEHQKKVINELKLQVFRKEAQETIKKHATEFFFGSGPIELPGQTSGA